MMKRMVMDVKIIIGACGIKNRTLQNAFFILTIVSNKYRRTDMVNDAIAEKLENAGLWRRAAARWAGGDGAL